MDHGGDVIKCLESFICEETLIRWSTSDALLSLLLGGDPLSTLVGRSDVVIEDYSENLEFIEIYQLDMFV